MRKVWIGLLGLGALALGVELVASPPAEPARSPVAHGRTVSLVVGLEDPGVDVDALAVAHGLTAVGHLPALRAVVMEGRVGSAARILAALRADSAVRHVSLNATFEVTAGCCEPRTFDASEAAFAAARAQLDAGFGALRRRTPGSPDALVAVLDTGCDTSHPDLVGAVAGGVSLDPGAPWNADRNGHGTAMASLVAGRTCAAHEDDTHGLEGVGPGLQVLSVRVADAKGRARLSDVAAGVVAAVDRGAAIVLLSLGARLPSPLLDEAVSYAEERGVLLVAAAGNTNVNVDLHPAADPRVLSVGCVRDDGTLAVSTALAPTTDVLAPGVAALCALPRRGYAHLGGSSVSAARMAAVAALTLELRPDLDLVSLRALLRGATRPLALFADDPDTARVFRAGVFDAGLLLRRLRSSSTPVLEDPRVLPDRARPGDRVRCSVRVSNPYPTSSEAREVVVDLDGERMTTLDVPALAPGEERVLAANVTVPAAGEISFSLGEARVSAPLGEGGPGADLAIASMTAEAGAEGQLRVRVQIEGRGARTEGARVSLRLGEELDLDELAVPALGPGEIAEVVFDADVETLAGLGEGVLSARAGLLGLTATADEAPRSVASLDLEVPRAEPRAAKTQYQQSDDLNLIMDAPFRLEPGRAYYPLLVFMAEKGDLDSNTWVEIDRAQVYVRDRPDESAGLGNLIYDDYRGGITLAPPGLVVTDEDGSPNMTSAGTPDVRLFQHERLTLPGRYNILRMPRAAFGIAPVPGRFEVRYADMRLSWRNRRRFLLTSYAVHSGSTHWVLRLRFGAEPRPRMPGDGAYYDGHVHTIAEWYADDSFDLLAPKKQMCGPLPMLMESAYAIGMTDAVDAVLDRVITTDHNGTYNAGDTIRDRPPFGPSSVARSAGKSEHQRHKEIFGDAGGEEITFSNLGPRTIGGVTLQLPGGVHLLNYRSQHIEGAWHGGSDLARLLGDPWPNTELDEVMHKLAKTNRAQNQKAATFAAHPYGDNDWTPDEFKVAFETDPATRTDLTVNAEGTGFVAKGVQLWNADGRRHKVDTDLVSLDWNDMNPFIIPSFTRGKDNWDKKLWLSFERYHKENLEPTLIYELASRPGWRFPRKVLVVAGNDAHGDFNFQTSRKATIFRDPDTYEVTQRAFGRVMTYVFSDDSPGATPAARALEAFVDGNSVITDGPLLRVSIDAEDRFDGEDLAWHDGRATWEDADGRMGGGGDFDGLGTALVPRGSRNVRFGYRHTNTAEFHGDIESVKIYRTSVGDPNPISTRPGSNDAYMPGRGSLVPGAPRQDHEEAIDPAEEGTIDSVTALQLGAFTAADPSVMVADEGRCYTNPIYCVPFDAAASVGRVDVDAAGNGEIPVGELTVTLAFDMSLTPNAYGVEIKALDSGGDSSDRSVGPIDILAPVTAGGFVNGWRSHGGAESSQLVLTNTRPIPLNLDRYPAPDKVTFVVYFRDAPQDPFGNQLNRVAFTFSEDGVGTGGGTGPALATTTPVGNPGSGTTAPGATASGSGGGSGGGGSGCALAPRSRGSGGALLLGFALTLLVWLRRRT